MTSLSSNSQVFFHLSRNHISSFMTKKSLLTFKKSISSYFLTEDSEKQLDFRIIHFSTHKM